MFLQCGISRARRGFGIGIFTIVGWMLGELFHPVLHRILFCPFIGQFAVIDASSGHQLGPIVADDTIYALKYSPCGTYILSSHPGPAENTGKLKIWNASNFKCVVEFHGRGFRNAAMWFGDENKGLLCVIVPNTLGKLYLFNFNAEKMRVRF